MSQQVDLPEQPIELERDPNETLAESGGAEGEDVSPAESVLAQFQRAMAQGGLPKVAAAPAMKSRREKLAEVAEQPIVKRAMELFDVEPGHFKYVPPGTDAN